MQLSDLSMQSTVSLVGLRITGTSATSQVTSPSKPVDIASIGWLLSTTMIHIDYVPAMLTIFVLQSFIFGCPVPRSSSGLKVRRAVRLNK